MAAVVRLPAFTIVLILFSCPLESWIPLWNFETIGGSLMRSKWLKLASLALIISTLYTFSSLVYSLLADDNHLKTILK